MGVKIVNLTLSLDGAKTLSRCLRELSQERAFTEEECGIYQILWNRIQEAQDD